MAHVVGEKARENSVRSLQNLYTVVVGLALSMAVGRFVAAVDVARAVFAPSLFNFLSFLLTLVPFYHGALRHLDITYVENAKQQPRKGALAIDFWLLFLEACVVLALAIWISEPEFFPWGMAALFLLDTIWGGVTYIAVTADARTNHESRWAWINIIAFFLLTILCVLLDLWPIGNRGETDKASFVLLVLCLVRTIVDYSWCWSTYYPQVDVGSQT